MVFGGVSCSCVAIVIALSSFYLIQKESGFPSPLLRVYLQEPYTTSGDQPIYRVLRKEVNAVQEGHSLGDSTSVLRVTAWSMREEQDRMPLDEVVFVRIVHRGMA